MRPPRSPQRRSPPQDASGPAPGKRGRDGLPNAVKLARLGATPPEQDPHG